MQAPKQTSSTGTRTEENKQKPVENNWKRSRRNDLKRKKKKSKQKKN